MGVLVFGALDEPLDALLAAARSCTSDDTAAMNEIIRRYEPLVRKIASSLTTDPDLLDDVRNAARLGIVRAVRAHDGRATGFVSFMTYYMRGEARQAIERCRTRDLPHSPESMPEPALPLDDVSDIETSLLAPLSGPQRKLVVDRYVEDRTMRDLAAEAGTSVAAVSQRLKTIHRILQPQLRRARWAV